MKEIRGDMWSYIGRVDGLLVTTNGFVKSNGRCVMGRGCARQAMKKWPGIDLTLGNKLREGNKVSFLVQEGRTEIWSFPVKGVRGIYDGYNVVHHMINKFRVGDGVPGWALVADLELIEKSARELVRVADRLGWKYVLLPRPGCGAGELRWEVVQELLSSILDDRFCCITY